MTGSDWTARDHIQEAAHLVDQSHDAGDYLDPDARLLRAIQAQVHATLAVALGSATTPISSRAGGRFANTDPDDPWSAAAWVPAP